MRGKQLLISGAALTMGVTAGLTTSVFATGADNITSEAELKSCLEDTTVETCTLGADITASFDYDKEAKTIDLAGNTLTLGPAIGSTGTTTNGARVLFGGELTIKNGHIAFSEELNKDGKPVLVGIANYDTLTIEDVDFSVAENIVIYTINNRGNLTLKGDVTVPTGKRTKNSSGTDIESEPFAITNDPYNYAGAGNAILNVDEDTVYLGTVRAELYGNGQNPTGTVELNISNGHIDKLMTDGNTAIEPIANVTGGYYGEINANLVKEGYFIDQTTEDVNVVKEIESNVTEGIKVDMKAESGEAINEDNLAGMLGQLEGTDLEKLNITKVVDITLCQVSGTECALQHEFDRSFRFAVDAEFPELAEGYTRKYYVVRYHMPTAGGDLIVDSWEVPYEDGKIVIESNLFSQFAIGYIDTETPKAPDTGANQMTSSPAVASVIASAVAGSAIALVFLALKRKNNR